MEEITIDIPDKISSQELERFRAIIPPRNVVRIGDHDLSRFMSSSGLLKITELKREVNLLRQISAFTNQELLAAGLYPVDIYAIRLSTNEGESVARDSNILKSNIQFREILTSNIRFPFLGLLGFDEDFYQQAREYIQLLIPEMSMDYLLIKFLVFFALFCPSDGTSNTLRVVLHQYLNLLNRNPNNCGCYNCIRCIQGRF